MVVSSEEEGGGIEAAPRSRRRRYPGRHRSRGRPLGAARLRHRPRLRRFQVVFRRHHRPARKSKKQRARAAAPAGALEEADPHGSVR